jgi:sulfur-carrier protein
VIVIRYFAWLRSRVGTAEERIDLPEGVRTVGELMGWIASRHPRFGEAMEARGVIRCARNHEHVQTDARIEDGDEIAFFPPVTGG